MNRRIFGVGAWVAIGLAGCGAPDSPEVQVRAVIEAAEHAAEARDVSAVMQLVSPDYADADGRQATELSRYLRGYFIANQSIHLLTRIDSLEFPARDVAEVEMTVAMVGREAEADSDSAWDLAADVHTLRLTLMEKGGDWRVTHADRPNAGR
ncbi:MAG: hypothetical protein ABL964_07480 [Steroidobacteraceae bacterium]